MLVLKATIVEVGRCYRECLAIDKHAFGVKVAWGLEFYLYSLFKHFAKVVAAYDVHSLHI